MDVSFRFKDITEHTFGRILRPVAKVELQSPKQPRVWTTTWMVVDTGADFTILPRYLVEDLGVSLEEDCMQDTTRGVGGEQRIYLCKIRLTAKIGSLSREIPVAFFDRNELPPLMGRLGFLETFDTEFLKRHVVAFKD